MPSEKVKMENDLERIKKRLQVSRKTLHKTEIKAENLESTIQTAIRDHEERKKKRSHE